MLQSTAYEVVFMSPNGEIHKTLFQHTSTWHRQGGDAKALDRRVLGMAQQAADDLGCTLLSAQKLESAGVDLMGAAKAQLEQLDSAFAELDA